MACEVCGYDFTGTGNCPACGFQSIPVVGGMTEEMKKKFAEAANAYKENLLKDVKVYIRGYHWEEENGQLIEKFHEDILIAEDIQKMSFGQTSYSEVVFAKQAAGEDVELTVVVENGGTKVHSVTVKAPDTEKMWNVGFTLKTGLKGAIKVGAGNNLVESNEFSLKG